MQQRRRIKSLARCLLALTLSFALVGLCWLGMRPHSLLDRSTLIPGTQNAAYYRWRSAQEMVLFPVEVQPQTFTRLVLLNTTTGQRTDTPVASAFPVPNKLKPNYLDGFISPDGKQLLWIGWTKTGGKLVFTVHSLDGPQQSQWTAYGNSVVYDYDSAVLWLPDNRRWVEWTTRLLPISGPFLPLLRSARLHDLDTPGKDSAVPVPQGTRTLLGFTPDSRLVSGAFDRNIPRNYSEVTLVISSLEGDGRAIQHYTIKIPAHATMQDVLLSPQGDRLLWRLQKEPSSLSVLMQKLKGKSVNLARAPLIDSLWVSGLDGGDMHEIGEQEGIPGRGGWPRQIALVQWRPDGRYISFYFGHAMYMIPVD